MNSKSSEVKLDPDPTDPQWLALESRMQKTPHRDTDFFLQVFCKSILLIVLFPKDEDDCDLRRRAQMSRRRRFP